MPPGGHITSDSDLESVISFKVRKQKERRNSGADKYFCSVEGCNQSFKRLDHLDRHVFKHTGIKKHACHYEGCTKIYSILTHLKRHIRCTHERPNKEPNKTVPCEVDTCDKLFTSLCNMHRHVREVHENPKVYKCQFCEEKFSQKLKMRRHEISKHTGVYPHSCDKCSKGFYQKWQWEKHEEICKVYNCLTCNQIFDKWSLFLKHCKETKHARQYYKCEYCDSAYVKPSDLQKHVAAKHISADGGTAVGEYKCHHEDCGRSYAYERNLRQHIVTAHKGKKFECTEKDCDKEFSSLQNLQKHIQRDHSDEKCASSSPAKNNKAKNLKRKIRKDAGVSKISSLVKITGVAVDQDLNKRLKARDESALNEVAAQLSQEMDVDSSFSEQEIGELAKSNKLEAKALVEDKVDGNGNNLNEMEKTKSNGESTNDKTASQAKSRKSEEKITSDDTILQAKSKETEEKISDEMASDDTPSQYKSKDVNEGVFSISKKDNDVLNNSQLDTIIEDELTKMLS